MKLKVGQIWKDKKNGNLLRIHSKKHDVVWYCVLIESGKQHKMTERAVNRYFTVQT